MTREEAERIVREDCHTPRTNAVDFVSALEKLGVLKLDNPSPLGGCSTYVSNQNGMSMYGSIPAAESDSIESQLRARGYKIVKI